MKQEILTIPTPFGEPLVLYKNRWGPANGETLSIVSGLQGDRVNGLIVASRLCRFLNEIESGDQPGYKIREAVQIFPIVNFKAWESGNTVWGFDSQDTDLTFPGMETGEVTETICNALIRHTADSDYGIILQTGEKHYEDAPHIKLIHPGRSRRNLARSLGIPIGREVPESPTLNLNLAWQWDRMGIQPLIVSAGKPQIHNPQLCDLLFDGMVNFMQARGIVSHSREKARDREMFFFEAQNECPVLTGQAGLFYPEDVLGKALVKGQKLGEVRDVYEGNVLEEIYAPEEGWVVTLRDHPMVHSGEWVAVLLREKNRSWFWPFT